MIDEQQIQAITEILMAAGIAEDEIAANMEALAAGLPITRAAASVLAPHQHNRSTRVTDGVLFPGEPEMSPAGPDAKAPPSFAQAQDLSMAPALPSPAAIDKEVAGATNDQLASLMAQATGGGGELLDPWADAPDMSGGRQGLRASQGIASPRAGAVGADGVPEMLRRLPVAGVGADGVPEMLRRLPVAGAELGAANEWMKYGGLAAGLAGTALGVAAPFLERDEEYEAALAQRASGDTVARKEMDYAAGQMRRNIMGSAMGRRDISPALAMRNAQMAQSQATSQMMARAAMASAQERQMAQNELAQIRKQRTGQAIDAGLAGLSQLGAFASTQYASQKQDALSQQKLQAYQDRTAAMRR